MSDFYERLFGCYDDCEICCLGLFFPVCLQASAVSKSAPNKSWVVPLMIAVCIPFFHIGMCINRATIRKNMGMKSSHCSDFIISYVCCFCATCQEYKEVTRRQSEHAKNKSLVEY